MDSQAPEEEQLPKPPRWWIAFPASLLTPGLGHLYAGSLLRSIVVAGVWWLWCMEVLRLWTNPSISMRGARLAMVGLVGLWLLIAAHAAWHATKHRKRISMRSLRITLYTAFVVISYSINTTSAYWAVANWVNVFPVQGEAMAPGLYTGDRALVDLTAYTHQNPKRGDVIVFTVARDHDGIHPADERPHAPRNTFAMRVVGLPHDTVAVRRGVVYINHKPLKTENTGDTYTDHQDRDLSIQQYMIDGRAIKIAIDPAIKTRGVPDDYLERSSDTPRQTIKTNRYFVMGDNRSHAYDSRFWGTVHQDDIIGPAVRIYRSRDAQSGAIRWGRIGRVVE